MKIRTFRFWFPAVCLLLAAFVVVCVFSFIGKTEESPASSGSQSAIPQGLTASELCEAYEQRMDPDIPKIEVVAKQNGVETVLPYDAKLQQDASNDGTWFLNLTKDFVAPPQLGEGAEFTIRFAEQPTADVAVIDYLVDSKVLEVNGGMESVYGYAPIYHEEKQTPRDLEYIGNHRKFFEAEGKTLSFALWEYYGRSLLSSHPDLRGLRLQCEFGETKAEYYILFQTDFS